MRLAIRFAMYGQETLCHTYESRKSAWSIMSGPSPDTALKTISPRIPDCHQCSIAEVGNADQCVEIRNADSGAPNVDQA